MKSTSLFIVDYRVDGVALSRLSKIGDVTLFRHSIVEGSLSGHPDISIFYNGVDLILSSDTPLYIIDAFQRHGIKYRLSGEVSGPDHPTTATYNAAGTADLLIHNLSFTATEILNLYPDKEIINIKQGYSRCSTLLLDSMHLITSDAGIAKRCRQRGKEVLLVESKEIILPGLEYGLFGGCCGLMGATVLVAGSLKYMTEGEKIHDFILHAGYNILELQETIPYDIGGIFAFASGL